MDDEKPEWIRVNQGVEDGIKIGPFSGNAILIEGAACLGGFLVSYCLVKRLGWPPISSLMVGALVPLVVWLGLMKLIVGKPRSYWSDWCEFQVRRMMRLPLVVLKKSKKETDEN
ncbi:MAG: hypothetical protein ACPGN3_15965 [Opitutales bacterium]